MNAKIAVRLGLLVAIIALGLGYIAFGVLGDRVGAQPFTVTVRLPRSGGLFTGAYVAYRGVDVGRVKGLRITGTGVDVTLAVDPGTRIPATSQVAVHDLSAVGEQYVDFTPRDGTPSGGALLHDGSVVEAGPHDVPLSIEQLLTDSSAFANSIDTSALSTLLQTTTEALNGSGPQLRTLLDATERLFSNLETVEPQTATLIQDSQPLLATTTATDPALTQFSAEIAQLTAQLQGSDADLSALLHNGAVAGGQLQSLLAADASTIESLTANSATNFGVTAAHDPAVQTLLEILPNVAHRLGTAVYGGQVHAHFYLNDDEPICTYQAGPLNLPTGHTEPPGAPSGQADTTCPSAPNLLQRGAANVPQAP